MVWRCGEGAKFCPGCMQRFLRNLSFRRTDDCLRHDSSSADKVKQSR